MKRSFVLFLFFLIASFISSFFISFINDESVNESYAAYNSLNTGAQVDAAIDHYQMKYYPDPAESDQGVTASGSGDTIYDILQTVGTSKYATIVLTHTGSGNTTNYTLDTSINLTTYPYVFILPEPGARLVRTTGDEIFTPYSPENLIVGKTQQITAVDMIDFAVGGTVYPEWWGAKAGGDYNANTTAFQASINSLTWGNIIFGPGTYTFSSTTIDVINGVNIYGFGPVATALRTSSATGNFIKINTGYAVAMKDMKITSSVTRTADALIRIDPSSNNFNSVFERLVIANGYDGLVFAKASDFTVSDCYIVSYIHVGINVSNTSSPDTGDSTINGCTFDAGSETSAVAIVQYSSGGLRIINNKFLAGAYQYLGQFNTYPDNTSILIIANNSFENANTTNIAFNSSSSTLFSRVIIANNQITVSNSASGISMSNPGYEYMYEMFVGGNIFVLGNSSKAMVFTRVQQLLVAANLIRGTGSSEIGIVTDSTVYGEINPQSMPAVDTPYSGDTTNVTIHTYAS